MDGQFLYRYFGESGDLLYNGRSNDWTRRLREHWRDDYWSTEIMSVTVERYPNLGSVVAAEKASIRAEHPRYNVQHNRPSITAADPGAGRQWTTEDILMIGLAIVVGYVIYKGTMIAVDKYRLWKAEWDEFRAWKQAQAEAMVTEVATTDVSVVPTEPVSVMAIEPVVMAAEEPAVAAIEDAVVVAAEEPVVVAAEEPVVPEFVPTTRVPVMNPLVAVAVAAMLCRSSSESTKQYWRAVATGFADSSMSDS